MHYLPRLLLRQFTDDGGLWELDIASGNCERRNIDNAGQERHLYTVALETGFLKAIDNDADTILKARIYCREAITLSVGERQRLAQWFATLVHRNPKKSAATKEFIDRAIDDPKSVLDRDVDYGSAYVETFKREHPEHWHTAIAQVEAEPELAEAVAELGAEEVLRQWVIIDVNNQIRTGEFTGEASTTGIFCRTINEERSEKWSGWMVGFTWTWLRTDQTFIIGDDPLCRWSTRLKHVEYGFAHDDCEVTIPLSKNLCLRMRRGGDDDMGKIVRCDYETTCKYNNRQILSATKKLYGPSRHMQREAQRWKDIALGRCRLPRG